MFRLRPMTMPNLRPRLVFALCLACAAHLAWGQAPEKNRSPFLPPNAPAGAGQTVGPNGVELHGIMSTASGTKYSIYDPAKRTSLWLAPNEAVDGIEIKSADPRGNSVTVAVNGQMVPLALKESKTEAGISGPGSIPIVLNPTPQDEQRRLQAVADEVRRRRLMREQAAQAEQQRR